MTDSEFSGMTTFELHQLVSPWFDDSNVPEDWDEFEAYEAERLQKYGMWQELRPDAPERVKRAFAYMCRIRKEALDQGIIID